MSVSKNGSFSGSWLRSGSIAIVALLIASVFMAAGSSQVDKPEDACTPHPPIHITEDAGPGGFVLASGSPVYRPGSGVSSGSGTQEDPYIIEGLCIASAEGETGGVRLEDTSAHVVIRDNLILDAPADGWRIGIQLEEASNVRIEDNHIRYHGSGVELRGSDGVRLEGNRIADTVRHGILFMDSHDAVVSGNSLMDNGGYGIRVLFASTGNTIEGNRIQGAPSWGVLIGSDSDRNEVMRNTIKFNGDTDGGGVAVNWAAGTLVQDNVITHNQNALLVSNTKNTVIHGNNIDGSQDWGLVVWPGATTVDARHNWWGCTGGPESTWCDQVKGSDVVYDPYRTGENPDAGA